MRKYGIFLGCNYIIGRGTTLSLLVTKLFTNLCFKDIFFCWYKLKPQAFKRRYKLFSISNIDRFEKKKSGASPSKGQDQL